MNTDNNDWIKRAAQEPKARDYPIWVCDPSRPLDGDRNNSGIYLRNFGQEIYSGVKYWKPCTVPAPPKPEPTQREEDEEAAGKWCFKAAHPAPNCMMSVSPHAAFLAGIAYRDAQNREDIHVLLGTVGTGAQWPGIVRRLRRRCGLDK